MEKKEKFLFRVTFYFLFIFLFSSFQSLSGNSKINSFYKSKNILFEIHNKNPVTFYCSCLYTNKKPNFKSCNYKPLKYFKRANRVEWEHIVPASRFGKKFKSWKYGHSKCIKNGKNFKGRKCTRKVNKIFRLIEADLYNLQPTIGEINAVRNNFKMSIIKGEKRNFGECDFEVKNNFVEPSPNVRGDIARTYFYMAATYSEYIKLTNSELNLFSNWDKLDPVDKWECLRAKLIKGFQKNLNKFIFQGCKE